MEDGDRVGAGGEEGEEVVGADDSEGVNDKSEIPVQESIDRRIGN